MTQLFKDMNMDFLYGLPVLDNSLVLRERKRGEREKKNPSGPEDRPPPLLSHESLQLKQAGNLIEKRTSWKNNWKV